MDNKLFYKDPYIKTFNARITRQEQDAAGNWYAVLDRTAFYPTGGGQPCDTGMIENRRVVSVEEIDGEIRHFLDGPLSGERAEITGEIDWDRRFDHMQQHSGQHILSAAFDNLLHYKTVGFHLGNETVTIDLESESLSREDAERAEKLANQVILENRPIETRWVTEDELSQFSLRKETKVKENIRLVIIPDFDYNGCGGTHPKSTGEVRAIKLLDWEKQKKNIRVQFVCGERVLSQFSQKQKVLLSLTKLLNSPEKELKPAVIRLLENSKTIEKELEKNREMLLQYEARDIVAGHENKIVAEVYQNRTIQELQKLARLAAEEDEKALILFVAENENRLQIVCARGAARTESMKAVIGHALPLIEGRGGGNDSFAQGGGSASMSGKQMLEQLLNLVK